MEHMQGKGAGETSQKTFFKSIKKRHQSVLQDAQDLVFLSGRVVNSITVCIFGSSQCRHHIAGACALGSGGLQYGQYRWAWWDGWYCALC